MAKVVDEDGNVNIGRPVAPENRYQPELFEGEWKRVFVITPKRSINNAPIQPFSRAYSKQREVFQQGQRQLVTVWMTQGEYVMSLLKLEVAVYGSD